MVGTPRLSILCPALLSRVASGQAQPMLSELERQANGLPVEVLVFADRGEMSIGEKHNRLYRQATGDYVCTVADDDRIEPDYVETLLAAIGQTDVVAFLVDWHGAFGWNEPTTCDFRPLAPCRRQLARLFTFPDWWQSEDRAFRLWLAQFRPTVLQLGKVLYHYQFCREKPEYGGRMYPERSAGMKTHEEVAEYIRTQPGPNGTYSVENPDGSRTWVGALSCGQAVGA